ncbi:MAG TPA: hypothetical protein VNI78_00615 [Vicinamibacterales bacterium]|nr:hypothetical protein [Vicinamibacterales bacterium]
MTGKLLLSCVVAVLGAGVAWAHHSGKAHTVSTIKIDQQVLAGGKPLAPGIYEVYVLDEMPETPEGTPSQNQRYAEIARDGQVIVREVAEVFWRGGRPREVVGTAGATESVEARVERLRSGDFLRIAINDSGNRYLIHLPTASANLPKPSPQEPQQRP